MSDGSDDFLAQAKRAAQPARDMGVRTDAHVSAESLMQRPPPVTPNTSKLYPASQTYGDGTHPTDKPVTPVTESDLRRQQLGHSGQSPAPERSGRLDHFPQHGAEQDAAKRPQLGSSLESQPAGTPLEAQRKSEQETAKAQLQADRAGTLTASDQAVSQTKAAEKAAEQAKVQQQAPPTQEH